MGNVGDYLFGGGARAKINFEKVFKLDSERNIRKAELFKQKLENQGYKVNVKTHGFNNIKIMWEG